MSALRGPRFKRGETYKRFLLVRSGDPSGATCRAVLKKARNGGPPGDDAEEEAVFTVTFVAHHDPLDNASDPAWLCVLSDEDSAALAYGSYVMDARIEIGGEVYATATEQVTVEERVTEDG